MARDGTRSFTERADYSGSSGSGRSSVTASSTTKNYQVGVLDGFINVNDNSAMRRLYREMYRLDSISCSWVNMMSNMPFSDFSLSGVKDQKVINKYMDCLDRLRLKLLLPQISIDYLALGTFLGTLNWNENDRLYDSIMPQDLDAAVLTPVPILGADPLVEIKISKDTAKLFAGNSPQAKRIAAQLPPAVLKRLQTASTFEIHPDNLIYIPKRGLSTEMTGVSALLPLTPIWMLEKALIRGTIEQAFSRRRALKHITAGGSDEWEPGADDMTNLAQMFLNADMNPDNAVVVTPDGIAVNEMAQGGDFWKITDIYDATSAIKMRALGVSDAFLSGDASYSTVDAAMSVFVENLKAYRGMVTREVFYDRIFPKIAQENNFTRKKGSQTELGTARGHNEDDSDYEERQKFLLVSDDENRAKRRNANLQTPIVVWHKRLEPEGDSGYLDMLTALTNAGLPIPLRTLAAASSQNMDDILGGYNDDIEVRKKIFEYKQRIQQYDITAQQGGDSSGGGGDGDQYASEVLSNLASRPSLKKKSLLSFNLDPEKTGAVELAKSGRPRPITTRRRRQLEEDANKNIVAARKRHREAGLL